MSYFDLQNLIWYTFQILFIIFGEENVNTLFKFVKMRSMVRRRGVYYSSNILLARWAILK